jgi:electron transfer flavoprotein beta subunit
MIAALLKLVDLRVEIDPLTGEQAIQPGGRALGASPADLAALETALRLAGEGTAHGDEVIAVCAGPASAAEATDDLLRELLAAGVARGVRVEISAGASSSEVAAAIAPVIAGARFVLCGDASLDRGSGSVPAFVAAKLQAAQALGLTTVTPSETVTPTATEAPGVTAVHAERRLDGGRREQLRVDAPAVLSVEAGLRLRRAPLAAVIRARNASIEVVRSPNPSHGENAERLRPYRAPAPPAPAAAAADPRARVLALTGMLAPARARRVVEASPSECADELLNYLTEHGYR